MAEVKKFRVTPYIPEKLKPLVKIANNLWWVWNFEAIDLFRRLDVDLWRNVEHNPIAMLGQLSQKDLDEAAESESFLAHMKRVEEALDNHLQKKSWFEENCEKSTDMRVAYFSAEFGLHECIPIYSGGLGILAGDHLKSSSEVGIPLVGVGLLYRLGYFHQYLAFDGWQQERYPETDFHNIPISLVRNANNDPLVIDVPMGKRKIYAQVWEVLIGRIQLYLLDTNIDINNQVDKGLTNQLYGGDTELRIQQELLLGVGGVRALRAMNKNISVFHMNEGHSAFLSVERIRIAMKEQKLAFNEALEYVSASSVFTTHTPVPAGNDRFTPEMIEDYLVDYYSDLGLTATDFLAFGRENPLDKEETFCMTVLAIKTASSCNGVSKLHGAVSRDMWKNIWPSLPVHEVPIDHITNGVQTLSWTSDEMMRLFNRYLGPSWIENPLDREIWQSVDSIPDSELWRCRERHRERLVGFARRCLKDQLIARGVSKKEIANADSVLDPDALTIVFARRFATYKRATLILQNMSRLEKILLDKERPVQIIFAGKAHPKDTQGKELIKKVIELGRDERFRNKIVFIEDYDINVARYLTQGCDIWLNNPVRPQEASGTSGMKVLSNGGLNVSILDGWWPEGYNTMNGWSIGKGEDYDDFSYQNEVESEALYNLLEQDIIPTFYSRGLDDVPREWIAVIKNSMKTLIPEFNTNRMVREYTEKFYVRAHDNSKKFSADNFKTAKTLANYKHRIHQNWSRIAIKEIIGQQGADITVGSQMKVKAMIHLGELKPEEVQVELHLGKVNTAGHIIEGASVQMRMLEHKDDGNYLFEGQMLCLQSGEFGFTVRVIPYHEDMSRKYIPGFITWA